MPEFIITTQRVWGRDLAVNNHIFFINKGGEESLSDTSFTEQEIIKATQQKFYGGPIEYFDARPSTIREGESTEIVWSAPFAGEVRLNGTPVDKQGTTGSLSPTSNTTYTLETVSNGKTESQTITVTVAPASETLIHEFDVSNSVIKKDDIVTLNFASESSAVSGALLNARMLSIDDVTGDIYFTDHSFTVRKCTQAGVVTTIAGSGNESGYVDATGSAARFLRPNGLCFAPDGNIYVIDQHRVRKVTTAGVVTTFAGGDEGYANNANPLLAKFNNPTDIVFDSSSNAYITDTGNHAIRKISSGGVVTTFAGSLTGADSGLVNSTVANSVRFRLPDSIDIDESGADFVLYISEDYNRAIRKITTSSGSFAESFTAVSNQRVFALATDGSDVYFKGGSENGVSSYYGKLSGGTITTFALADSRHGVRMAFYNGFVYFSGYTLTKVDPTSVGSISINDEGYSIHSNTTSIAGSPVAFIPGFRDGTGVYTFSAGITADDPDFSFLPPEDPRRALPVWAQPRVNFGLSESGSLVISVQKTTTFTLTATSGGTTNTRTLTVNVYESAEKISPWPVFKTSSGRAIGVGRSISQTNAYSRSQSDAVSDSSVFRARSWSRSSSYSTDTKVTVTEISNVLTRGYGISNSANIAPTSVDNIIDSDPYNSASRSITHRDQRAISTSGVDIPASYPHDIPRGGLYLIDYKIEYYKWGWFRCITTIIDAAQFR
jgi:sugar lactone lactonase YvrE